MGNFYLASLLKNQGWIQEFFVGGITWKNWKKWLPQPLAAPKIDGFSYVFMHILKKLGKNLEKIGKNLENFFRWVFNRWGNYTIFLPSSAPISVSAWAEIILVPDNPGKPAEWPSGIVIFSSNTAFKSKLKVFYSMNRTLK